MRQPWTKHIIVPESSRHTTVNDFSGNGQANDVFTFRRDEGFGVYWYEYAGDGRTEFLTTSEWGYFDYWIASPPEPAP